MLAHCCLLPLRTYKATHNPQEPPFRASRMDEGWTNNDESTSYGHMHEFFLQHRARSTSSTDLDLVRKIGLLLLRILLGVFQQSRFLAELTELTLSLLQELTQLVRLLMTAKEVNGRQKDETRVST